MLPGLSLIHIFLDLAAPVEVVGEGKVQGLKCVRMVPGVKDEKLRRSTTTVSYTHLDVYKRQVMLRREGDIFLDDVSLEELSEALQIQIITVPNDGYALLDAVVGREEHG